MGLEPICMNSSDVDIVPYEIDFKCRRMGYFNPYILPHSSQICHVKNPFNLSFIICDFLGSNMWSLESITIAYLITQITSEKIAYINVEVIVIGRKHP